MQTTHYIYKITNQTTDEYYYGKRTCKGHWRDDTYMGSGTKLRNKMNAHPDQGWCKEVLLVLDTEEEAYEYEAVVIGDRWKTDPLCLNLTEGGMGVTSEYMEKRWEDPEYHQAMCETGRLIWEDPEYQAKMSSTRKAMWEDPEYRAKMSVIRQKTAADPKFRDMLRQKALKRWEDADDERERSSLHRRSKTISLNFGDGEVTISTSNIKPYLRMGATFKTRQVDVHCDQRKVMVRLTGKTATRLILSAGFDWGTRRGYTRTTLTQLKADGILGD